MAELGTITREEIADEVCQDRDDKHKYFFLLISTDNSPTNYHQVVNKALVKNNECDWKKVEGIPNVKLYFGHFESREKAAQNRLKVKKEIETDAENAKPHLILSEAFCYREYVLET
ncbi:hypothetical protein RclHR1_01040010 [Rhizophagus clarus]|uniref:Uncharacterized protein n=1 Tax=Rhizophagus clarus TaxID=94130 RepID=A0A2Z6Q2G5_9GLOM|nr:hypothetical protein RclHR1_01040010 [Rhizophagus clarus]GES77887.1 hypothetical protein RCL_jg29399.t1 [Rhizophagus clarus]